MQQHTISQLNCDQWRKVGFIQLAMTSSVTGPRRRSKALTKSKVAPIIKVLITVWWSTAAHLIHYSFLNPDETIISEKSDQQIDEMHWKLERMQPVIGQQKGPSSSPGHPLTTCHTTSASKVEQIGLCSFASSAIFTWPVISELRRFQASRQLFAGKMLPQPSEGRKCFQEFVEFWASAY